MVVVSVNHVCCKRSIAGNFDTDIEMDNGDEDPANARLLLNELMANMKADENIMFSEYTSTTASTASTANNSSKSWKDSAGTGSS